MINQSLVGKMVADEYNQEARVEDVTDEYVYTRRYARANEGEAPGFWGGPPAKWSHDAFMRRGFRQIPERTEHAQKEVGDE